MNNIIAVKFKEDRVYKGKEYLYRTDKPVSVGDEVIVNISDTEMNLQVALVTRTNISDGWQLHNYRIDYIVQVIDTTDYRYFCRRRSSQRVVNLKKKLDERVREYQEERLYESIAKIDDEFRELYLEYKQELDKFN